MHMFTRSLMCTQNTEEIQLKLWEELITQSMHYQLLVFRKCLKFKNTVGLSKNIFSSSNFFMHIFNMSVTHMQNIKEIQLKL